MVERIKGHFLTCATLRDVAQPLRREYIAGVSACVTSLRLVLKPSVNRPVHSDEDTKLRKKYIQGLIDDLDARRDGEQRTVAHPRRVSEVKVRWAANGWKGEKEGEEKGRARRNECAHERFGAIDYSF